MTKHSRRPASRVSAISVFVAFICAMAAMLAPAANAGKPTTTPTSNNPITTIATPVVDGSTATMASLTSFCGAVSTDVAVGTGRRFTCTRATA